MTKQWFLCFKDVITGPHSTADVVERSRIEDLSQHLVWWKGFIEWMPIHKELSHLNDFLGSQVEVIDRPLWHYKLGGRESNPLSIKDLMLQLKDIPNFSTTVLIKSPDSTEWLSVFKHLDLMDAMGINQRKNRRVPLRGSINLLLDNRTLTAQALTISVGGIGVRLHGENLFEGQKTRIEIKSPDLPLGIHANGKIVHVSTTGEYGISFEQLHPEHLSTIGDYLRKITASNNLRKGA